MELLFNNSLRPITSRVAFIEGDLNSVVNEFLKWQTPLISKYNNSFDERTLNENLKNTLLSLCPLTTIELRRFLFIPTENNNWVAFFDNGHMGTDRTAPEVLGKRLNVRTIYISYDLGTGEILFDFYDQIENSIDLRRSLAIVKESTWTFYQYGTPLPFEKLENYKARQIKKKFNIELLNEYLFNLGIDAFNEDFYRCTGTVILNKQGPKFQDTKELDLREAQNWFS